ncbi:glycosyltransferase family 4 protein [Halorubrum ezzemoulense]|uniref:glycosyltransferase family 4 protein n=1 Tax=Halorubrum ezzemoulense TaxID=337243 RepID=UPI0023307F0A|nr:glycosyltransferase family 4 protein [Halorubrum ezzemoulense]MDB9253339.1 glycosyltransferase family 4 protein [Halorubrum ezzemoulense]MDB9256296.1 glycosyltransferase family 4 protein [Halorubrum ezzemoulense]MDB9277656.1 glycosyltransferase family 4 protein [Halorubrum ezzemoulense]
MEDILLFTPKYPPAKGGASTFYSNLISSVSDSMNFHVVTTYNSEEPVVTHQERVSIYRILPRVDMFPTYLRILLEISIVFMTSAYILVKEDINIIHAHASSFSVISLTVVSTIFRVPIAYDCRDEAFRPWIIQMGYAPVWFSCASNIDEILMRNGVPKDRIIRLPVVNPDYVQDYRSVDDSQTVSELLYIGSLREAKGIFVLLEAFKTIREYGFDLHLTVIGEGPARDEFVKSCQELNLKEYVTFKGSLSHDETLCCLSESGILILPSESEGVPRVVLESHDVGTPVVATAVGGIPDVISHKENGMLAERTAESIAENVFRLVRDDKLYQTIVNNSIKDADKRNWERVREQLYEGYEEVCSYIR